MISNANKIIFEIVCNKGKLKKIIQTYFLIIFENKLLDFVLLNKKNRFLS